MVYGRTIKETLKLLQSKHSFKFSSKKATTKLEEKPYDSRKCRVQDFSRLATTTSACRGHESFPIKYNEKLTKCVCY